MAFTGAARTVVARLFRLINQAGQIIGELKEPIPGSAQLAFWHTYDTIYSGSINWNTTGTPLLYVEGPAAIAGNPSQQFFEDDGITLFSGGGLGLPSATAVTSFDGVSVSRSAIIANNGVSNVATVEVVVGSGTPFARLVADRVAINPTSLTTLNGRQIQMFVYQNVVNATGPVLAIPVSAVPGAGANVPGVVLVVALLAGDIVNCTGVVDFFCSVGGAGVAVGELEINNVAQPAIITFDGAAGDRGTVSQQWIYTVPADGNYQFHISVRQSAAGATYDANSIHTTLRVVATATN